MFKRIILCIALIMTHAQCIAIKYDFDKYEKHPKMLLDGKYEELTNELNKIFIDHKNNIVSDYEMDIVLRSFDRRENNAEMHLNNWVKKSKSSYIPRMIRGVYYNRVGWRKRGGKWGYQTNLNQYSGLRTYQNKALNDFKYVINKNKSYPHAYAFAIDSFMSLNRKQDLKDYYRKFNQIDPANLIVKLAYIKSLTPRWGGSYIKMKEVVESCEPYFKSNPELNILKGSIYSEMSADIQYPDDITQQVQISHKKLDLINKALIYGDYYYYYHQKAYALKQGFSLKKAYKAVTDAINLRPHAVRLYTLRVDLALKARNILSASKDLDKLLQLNYNYPSNSFKMGLSLYGLERYKEAISYFTISLKHLDNESLKNKAIKYINLSKKIINAKRNSL